LRVAASASPGSQVSSRVDNLDTSFPEKLAAACPNGIDVYFENVGGAVWRAVLPLLNRYARVPVCGLTAQYNGVSTEGPDPLREILSKSLTLRGFLNFEFVEEHYPAFLEAVSEGLSDGSILHREDITEGLENAPRAFIGMLRGENFGKALVRLATER
jgi:NADPH-dependent curcumin reductase CurA